MFPKIRKLTLKLGRLNARTTYITWLVFQA